MGNQIALRAGAQLRPIIPESFEDCQRMAAMAIRAGMFKHGTDEARLAYATMAIMQGAEVGMTPMLALQNIAVINGNCRIWGKAVPALIRSAGHRIESHFEGDEFKDNWKAVVRITRGDTGEVIERSFSWAQAKRAKLADRDLYKLYPDRMMYWRALGYCCTDGCPEVLCGMYMREEIDDEERREVTRDVSTSLTVIDVPSAPEEAAPKEEAKPAPAAAEQQAAQSEPSPDDMLSALDVNLMACKTLDQLGEVWDENSEAISQAGRDTYNKAQAIYEKHEARLKPVAQADAEHEFDMSSIPAAE